MASAGGPRHADDPFGRAKSAAAARGALQVADGQTIGLGSGSTVDRLLPALGARMRSEGLHIRAVAASKSTEAGARAEGIPLLELDAVEALDVALDGADEVDRAGRLIKGGGGALLREKLVALAGRRLIVMVDERKPVQRLGSRMPLPVEVVAFGWRHTARRVAALGLVPALRGGPEAPYRTDNGNYILDCAPASGEGPDLAELAPALKALPGVVEHGLFPALPGMLIVGRRDGSWEERALGS